MTTRELLTTLAISITAFTAPHCVAHEEKSWAHPVIAGGKLYLRDQDVSLCYDVLAR